MVELAGIKEFKLVVLSLLKYVEFKLVGWWCAEPMKAWLLTCVEIYRFRCYD